MNFSTLWLGHEGTSSCTSVRPPSHSAIVGCTESDDFDSESPEWKLYGYTERDIGTPVRRARARRVGRHANGVHHRVRRDRHVRGIFSTGRFPAGDGWSICRRWTAQTGMAARSCHTVRDRRRSIRLPNRLESGAKPLQARRLPASSGKSISSARTSSTKNMAARPSFSRASFPSFGRFAPRWPARQE